VVLIQNRLASVSRVQKRHTHHGIIIIMLFFVLHFPLFADNGLSAILAQSHCGSDEKKAIEELFVNAEKQKVPFEMLYPRLEEGIAKRVDCRRLIIVLEHEIGSLVKARAILLSVDPGLLLSEEQALWMRTSIMLDKGFKESTVKDMVYASRFRWKDFKEATILFVNLVQWGLNEYSAAAVIELAMGSRIPGEEFSEIVSIFTKGRKYYIAPEEIIRRIKEVIADVGSIRSLEERVIY
jgi:hypothetical protein